MIDKDEEERRDLRARVIERMACMTLGQLAMLHECAEFIADHDDVWTRYGLGDDQDNIQILGEARVP